MTIETAGAERSPMGDHNRRLALELSIEQLAAEAGVGADQLYAYETTGPHNDIDRIVANRIGETLARLEAAAAD